jgi:NADH-quinone oxidoreductase subunit E
MPTDVLSAIQPEFKGEREELIAILQRSQGVMGYLSPDAIRQIARWLKVSENEVFGVATFYAHFRLHPPGEHHIRVCLGTACHVKGGKQILDTATRRLKIKTGETTADGRYDLERVACLGCCALAPVVTMDDKTYGLVTVLRMEKLLDDSKQA